MDRSLNLIYQRLYSHFGSQHWWPAESPFEVMIGAILTQNTNWQNVEKAIANLKENNLLKPKALYNLPHKQLAGLIRPSGYYNIKAKRLKNFLRFFIKHYRGSAKNMSWESTPFLRRQLLSVKGIGPETADSILLYALDKPIFVVDAYTKRILLRHGFIPEDTNYDETQNLFMQSLKSQVTPVRNTKSPKKENKISKGARLFNEYHALLVKLGKEYCLKNKPKCDICPLKLKSIVHSILFLLVTGYWLLVTNCYAAPCYGTKMPQAKKISTGFQTHSIFKRYLEDEFGKVRSTQHFLLISYGLYDWLSIDLKGGAGNIKQHPIGSDEVDYTSNFAGGYGFRLRFFDTERSRMVFGFQHLSVHPKSTHLGIVKNQAILDDWQFSLLASRNFKKFAAYLGTRWSRVDYIHKVADNRKRKMSDLTKSLGLIYGLDFSITQRIWVNLEASAFDSEALAGSINYKF